MEVGNPHHGTPLFELRRLNLNEIFYFLDLRLGDFGFVISYLASNEQVKIFISYSNSFLLLDTSSNQMKCF